MTNLICYIGIAFFYIRFVLIESLKINLRCSFKRERRNRRKTFERLESKVRKKRKGK